ncbi:hypothetical protein [Corallibacter sp.]|uniref:hypothetical protein n=1 Tax=Corallibacter sp. TaxID=2038084 RepID=UPI003A90BBB0
MKSNNRIVVAVISGVTQGLIFATIMALFQYNDESYFNWKQFLFYFLSMGIFTGLISVSKKKNQKK